MPDGVVLTPAYLAEVRARCEAIRSRTFDGPVARAMDDTAWLLAAAEGYAAAVAEAKRLREALSYLQQAADLATYAGERLGPAFVSGAASRALGGPA